jgi:hypothetical protein
MKIIPKIVLYIAVVLLLSVSLDEDADSRTNLPIKAATLSKRQTRMRATPYSIGGKIRINNLVYKEKIVLRPNEELSR